MATATDAADTARKRQRRRFADGRRATPRQRRMARRAARRAIRRRRVPTTTQPGGMEVSASNLELIHDQIVAALVAETAAFDTRLDAIVFGSQNGQAYVDYIESMIALLEWTEGYQTRHAAYEIEHQAFTTGGR